MRSGPDRYPALFASVSAALILSMTFSLMGCSGKDEPAPEIVPGANDDNANQIDDVGSDDVSDVEDDLSDSTNRDADLDVEDVEQDTDPFDVDNGDGSDATEDPSPCGEIIELGLIDGNFQRVLQLDVRELQDDLMTSCDTGSGRGAIISFQLAQAGTLSVSTDTSVALSLRDEPCGEDELLCRENALNIEMAGGPPLFLVIEELSDEAIGEIALNVEFHVPESCAEAGLSECLDEDTIRACNVTLLEPDTAQWHVEECPAGCANGRCLGDSCDTAIVVEESLMIAGNKSVLFNNHSSAGINGCGPDGGVGGFNNGRELVFELPNLTTESQVTVQAEFGPGFDFLFQFKNTCEDEAECLAFGQGDEPFIFIPPADGRYFLFAETPHDIDGMFYIGIEIDTP